MSLEPEVKRRKMEPHVGGDDNTQESAQVSSVLASKTLLKAPTGSPSGDFGNPSNHQFISLISSENVDDTDRLERNQFEVCRQACEFGDSWMHKYPVPLSKFPQRPIRTGNLYYDGIIVDLELIGYKPLQVIAKGRSGTVILAQNLHQPQNFRERETVPVALKLNSGKRLRNRSTTTLDVLDEMVIQRQLHHPNIVSWISNINYKGRVGTVMEFCENGNLEQLIKIQDARFLTEGVARRYFRQILGAIDYVHSQGFAHRDICLQNVLITQNNVPKLTDFGHAVKFSSFDPLCEDECGSLGYQAPEILEKNAFNPKLADIWSLGALLHSMCVGRLPLGLVRSEILANASKEIRFPEQRVLPLSKELRILIRGHMAYNPAARFSLNRIAHSDWVGRTDKRVQIGNFYKIRQPQKTNEGNLETKIKMDLLI